MHNRFYYILSNEKSPGCITAIEIAVNEKVLTLYTINDENDKSCTALNNFVDIYADRYNRKVYAGLPLPLLHNQLHSAYFVNTVDDPSQHVHIEFEKQITVTDLKIFFEGLKQYTAWLKKNDMKFANIHICSASPEEITQAFKRNNFDNEIYFESNNKSCETQLRGLNISSSHYLIEQFILTQQKSITQGGPTCPLQISSPKNYTPHFYSSAFTIGAIGLCYLFKKGFLSCLFKKRPQVTPRAAVEDENNVKPSVLI